MRFQDEEHEKAYKSIMDGMSGDDVFHSSVAYLIALDSTLREHINEVFDFERDSVEDRGLGVDDRDLWKEDRNLRYAITLHAFRKLEVSEELRCAELESD
jgi:hypothetical protein